jgi:exodeoxyribonuclease VII large subunit
MLDRRKRALAAEGLFNERRKRPIPRFPQTIAVVTSPTGAVIRDIINVLARRAGGLNIIILPTPVQGDGAGPIIANRIAQANRWQIADVLIVARGGGSLEDLLPFSDEVVVRAIAASAIPVISAVGHETDVSLADYAADLRAPTPSAAAELVSADYTTTQAGVIALRARLARALQARIENMRLAANRYTPEYFEQRFRYTLQNAAQRCDDAKSALASAMQERVNSVKHRLAILTATLESESPLAVLERGYTVVVNETTGAVVKRPSDALPGDTLRIHAAGGILWATAILPRTAPTSAALPPAPAPDSAKP